MLSLYNIKKDYGEGDARVQALKGVTLHFRKSEFVSVLGASGCGKTTLLNIIGGLDQYTSGDLVISGKSTKEYKDRDWDAYRNASIGFVFQSYNLIHHQTVLANVELALTLSGVSRQERRERAIAALKEVGLESQIHKLPNQLSGGQMQRVAIARALVNDPEIILADEPTGALDTATSVQIMDILKEIAKDRLIIMVTHNPQIAETYSTRIIRLVDGEVVDDTNPFDGSVLPAETESMPAEAEQSPAPETGKKREKGGKTSMSYLTALSLSLKNLFTKKTRTFLTAFAGSIGIIGIALVLAISSGLNMYIEKLQRDTLSSYPLTISAEGQDMMSMMQQMMELQTSEAYEEYPEGTKIFVNNLIEKMMEQSKITNDIAHARQFLAENVDESLYYAVQERYDVELNAYLKTPAIDDPRVTMLYPDGKVPFEDLSKIFSSEDTGSGSSSVDFSAFWQEVVDSEELLSSQYDVLTGMWPEKENEIVLLVDQYNRINDIALYMFGYFEDKEYDFSDFMGKKFTYTSKEGENVSLELEVVGIVRVNQGTSVGALSSSTVIGYSRAFTQYFLEAEGRADELPVTLAIYPRDFDTKEEIKNIIKEYNATLTEETKENKITVTDLMQIMVSMVNTFIDSVSYVLIAFTAVSLVVSSIMIGIITYISVLERTKEIGVLRALGARKKDISRVFNAETLVIGFIAGLLGVVVTYLLTIPINAILFSLTEIAGLAQLVFWHAVVLVAISCLLTLVAGLIPSRIAAKKDPVVALRTE